MVIKHRWEGHPLVRITIQVITRVKRTPTLTSHRIPTPTDGKELPVISCRIRRDPGLTIRCTGTDTTVHAKQWAILPDWNLMPCQVFLLLGIEQQDLMMTALI